MTEDLRCCGTGTCLINAEGVCWCGQRWDGTKMCFPDKPDSGKPALHPDTLTENAKSDAAPAAPLPDPSPPNRSF